MTARVVTVGAAEGGGNDEAPALAVARALRAEGVPVVARMVVDEDEAALESVLAPAVGESGLVVVLAPPGGSGGDVVRRVLARLAGVRLVLSERLLRVLEDEHARRGRALPRRLERLALLPQGAQLWIEGEDGAAASGGWSLELRAAVVAVLSLAAADLGAVLERHLRPDHQHDVFHDGVVELLSGLGVDGPGEINAGDDRADVLLDLG
ncbi:MAG TPA: hypothetical protein VJU81_23505, partial [Methylomirabilota bacterium]|nr:hypothetical protein [Methylomirabilota bacterium]